MASIHSLSRLSVLFINTFSHSRLKTWHKDAPTRTNKRGKAASCIVHDLLTRRRETDNWPLFDNFCVSVCTVDCADCFCYLRDKDNQFAVCFPNSSGQVAHPPAFSHVISNTKWKLPAGQKWLHITELLMIIPSSYGIAVWRRNKAQYLHIWWKIIRHLSKRQWWICSHWSALCDILLQCFEIDVFGLSFLLAAQSANFPWVFFIMTKEHTAKRLWTVLVAFRERLQPCFRQANCTERNALFFVTESSYLCHWTRIFHLLIPCYDVYASRACRLQLRLLAPVWTSMEAVVHSCLPDAPRRSACSAGGILCTAGRGPSPHGASPLKLK